MIFGVLESFNDSPLLLYLAVISIACIGGGIPPCWNAVVAGPSKTNCQPSSRRSLIRLGLAVVFRRP